jgi:hypothetical protein
LFFLALLLEDVDCCRSVIYFLLDPCHLVDDGVEFALLIGAKFLSHLTEVGNEHTEWCRVGKIARTPPNVGEHVR